MSSFSFLMNKANSALEADHNTFKLKGISESLWSFIYFEFFKLDTRFKSSDILICKDEDQAEKLYDKYKHLTNNCFFFPGLGEGSYTSILQSESSLFYRYNSLQKLNSLKDGENFLIITTLQALYLLLPPVEHFKNSNLIISTSDIISPNDLAQRLVHIGYQSTPTVEEPGTFSKKGEIFDIFPLNGAPKRIHYFDDMIEEIYEIDRDTLKTIKDHSFDNIVLSQSPHGVLNDDTILNLRSNLPSFPIKFKNKNSTRNIIFEKLSNRMLFDNYPLFYSLFFENHSTLLDHIKPPCQLHFFDFEQAQNDFDVELESINNNYNHSNLDVDNEDIYPNPQLLFTNNLDISRFNKFKINTLDINVDFENDLNESIDFYIESTAIFFRKNFTKPSENRFEFVKNLLQTIQLKLKDTGKLFIVYKNESTKKELEFLIEQNFSSTFITNNITYLSHSLSSGFYYPNEDIFFLSESDLFTEKVKKTKRNRKHNTEDLFADQIQTLKIGDYLIHKTYGVGKYLGMETISMAQQENDFLVIQYTDNDKVYLPVYKLNLVQKHADNLSDLKVDSLKSKKFDAAKSKARSSVKKLAFDLLELNAKRKVRKGFAYSPPDHLFKEFELDFQFEETPDQLSAIDDVLEDMQSERPMDRLICGDVGFGKTEVAMRASFKAVLDKKQVALLVPTTVLAFQHYNSFIKRFSEFPVNIEYISRFKSAKQVKEILEKLSEGKIDILIGTHKLLSSQVKFYDLGLVIIDEEQRFGVSHKEKLKLLKESVDCMVMTATPIPRTLQLSFLGIKELSLIKTAPPKRQSIKTYVIKDDGKTIKTAIQKEISRGGQVFIVHNRVNDIEEYAAYIRKLAPDASIIIAHGQMAERELEKRIKDFYDHKYDILISTTIIESGIDIPAANTMIIDRADTYGLSQLHQLRGRIGRSDKKAYAYFIIPSNRNLSTIASKRLQALQNYADMGAGFSLATSDLEIRGSGDILGAEQSGHIANIGLELYMELLKEAIHDLKGDKLHKNNNIEIQTPFAAFIPNQYIEDTGLRLKYYKRLSNCDNFENLDLIIDEVNDQFGLPPEKVKNLYAVLRARIYLQNIGLTSVKVQSKTIILNFNKEELDNDEYLRNLVLNFFMKRPKVYKLSPNYSVNCKFNDTISIETLLEFAKYIAEQIEAC